MQEHEPIIKIISVILVTLAVFVAISDYYSKEKAKSVALNSNIKAEQKFKYPQWGEDFSNNSKLDKFVSPDISRIFSSYPEEVNCYKNENEAFCYLDNKFVAKINFFKSLEKSQGLNQTINDIATNATFKTELFKEEKGQDIIFHQTINNDGITFSIPKNNNIVIVKNETLMDKILFNQELVILKNAKLIMDELNKK